MIQENILVEKSEKVLNAASWETYNNEKYGFEVNYPNFLTVKEFEDIYSKGISINFPSGSVLGYRVGPNYDVAGNKSIITIDGKNYDFFLLSNLSNKFI